LKLPLKHISAFVLFIIVAVQLQATHFRAGEITYIHLSGTLYRITVITYTDPGSVDTPAPPTNIITIKWGDGTANTDVQRKEKIDLTPDIQKNVYVADHEYNSTSEGSYMISITDFARVGGIANINGGQTSQIPFYIETLIRVSKSYGINQSPVLTIPPIVNGCTGFLYLHNPGAADPDGDSLAYTVIPPKQAVNENVPNYNTPPSTDSFRINPITGTLYWANPKAAGVYNIAILISEYRYGDLVGSVMRDMQIFISDCGNSPPSITTPADQCVNAGDTAKATITATDSGNQVITLRGYGGPFEVLTDKAYISPNPSQGIDFVATNFIWKTNCSHIRFRPYQAVIEAKDNGSVPMANYATFNIKVVGPAPETIVTKQVGNGFRISWTKDPCKRANTYKIYRRTDSSHWSPAHCETGIPGYTGFKLIGLLTAKNDPDTFFYDNDRGKGLSPMVNYCYRVISVFPPRAPDGSTIFSDSAESYASIEVCDAIIRSKPIITHVSITTTDVVNGALKLAWLRPDTLDTIVYTAPYRLIFKRAVVSPGTVNVFTSFKTIDYPSFVSFNDSSVIDSNINTTASRFKYKIELWYDSLGSMKYVDESPVATSVYTNVYSTDNTNILSWNEQVPWLNQSYTVYRRIPPALIFDSIATVTSQTYNDEELINHKQYCYYITSSGGYSFYPPVLLNNSQQICGTPIDTVRPCAPLLAVSPPCDLANDFSNRLSWSPPEDCADDVVAYKIYFKKLITDPFQLLATINHLTFTYIDSRESLQLSIAGCYAVSAVDSFGNESFLTGNTTCTENCPYYDIPNVFSPNGDGKNDLLNPFPYRFIDHIQLSIYNRWGQPVFQTMDPMINWDGKDHLTSKKDCTEGVYYYTCTVFENYLEGVKKKQLRGTIQLVR
jgi:gliding motility-associated-like protein